MVPPALAHCRRRQPDVPSYTSVGSAYVDTMSPIPVGSSSVDLRNSASPSEPISETSVNERMARASVTS